jgi:hypothetical protein
MARPLVGYRELNLDRRVPLAELGERIRSSAASAASRSPAVPAPANSASTFRSFSRNLREIDRHRQRFATRLRKASDDIIDGDITEHYPASSAAGLVTKTTNHDPGKPAAAASGQP